MNVKLKTQESNNLNQCFPKFFAYGPILASQKKTTFSSLLGRSVTQTLSPVYQTAQTDACTTCQTLDTSPYGQAPTLKTSVWFLNLDFSSLLPKHYFCRFTRKAMVVQVKVSVWPVPNVLQLINILDSTAVVSWANSVMLLLSAVLQLVKAVHKSDFRLSINWIPNHRCPVESDNCSDRHLCCWGHVQVFSKVWVNKKGPQLSLSRSKPFSSVQGSVSLIGPQNNLLVVVVVVVVRWERIWGPAAPMHLGRTNEPFVHRF
jgi:hypothetical protein